VGQLALIELQCFLRNCSSDIRALARSQIDAYPVHTAIKLILDNHSAHISKETRAWVAEQPVHRFEFTFTPKHGSWLNLVEGFFSKLARSVLRHIRVASKQELKDRIMAAWITSIRSLSFTPGPSNSIRLLDMIRISETMI
jgi:transposase